MRSRRCRAYPDRGICTKVVGVIDEETRSPKARHGGSVLMAAMLGLADAMGHDRERVDIVEAASDDHTGDLPLDFGDLRPLDWRDE
ncbi:MAG: hypothetical protein ACI8TP_000874 [Acidimicrobiales bacterium]|jgi:hypothetical protein